MESTYGLWIIFEPNFKDIIKKNKTKFDNTLKKSTEYVNNFKGDENVKNIHEYLNNYEIVVFYNIIDEYYKNKDFNLILWSSDDFKFKDLFNKPEYADIEKEYGEIFLTLKQFYIDIITTVLAEELYKNKDKIKGTDFDKSLKKYTNKTITEELDNYNKVNYKYELKFPFIFLVEEVCNNKLFTDLIVCNQSGIIKYYEDLVDKYYYRKDNIDKINDKYYELFNILYIINANKFVCDAKILIHKDSNDIDDIINDLTITVYTPDAMHDIKYKHSIINFIEVNGKNYKIEYNDRLPDIVKQCIGNKKFIVINISLIHGMGGHANSLIYNPNFNEVEIFEPKLDEVKDKSLKIVYEGVVKIIFGNSVKYIASEDYITHNIQDLQEKEFCTRELGHCVSWTLWYIDHRLDYPKKNAKDAFEFIFNSFIKYPSQKNELSKLIANYVKYVKAQRITVLTRLPDDSKEKKILEKEWGL